MQVLRIFTLPDTKHSFRFSLVVTQRENSFSPIWRKVTVHFPPGPRLVNIWRTVPLICIWRTRQAGTVSLKGLSHEIFGPVSWPVCLNKNRFWFLNFKEAPSIWGSHFKFLCVSVQTFSEILRISEDLVANPSPRTGDSVANHSRRFYDSPRKIFTLSSVSRRTANQKSTKIGELQAQLPILLWDSKNLGEYLAWNASKFKIIM